MPKLQFILNPLTLLTLSGRGYQSGVDIKEKSGGKLREYVRILQQEGPNHFASGNRQTMNLGRYDIYVAVRARQKRFCDKPKDHGLTNLDPMASTYIAASDAHGSLAATCMCKLLIVVCHESDQPLGFFSQLEAPKINQQTVINTD